MKQILLLAMAVVLVGCAGVDPAAAPALVERLRGAKIFSQEKPQKYLGEIASQYVPDSIFFKYGAYGNKYHPDSIWNKYGRYGQKYSAHSPFNKNTLTPPMIVSGNKIIGYLTVNPRIGGGLAPDTANRLMTR